jgi:hypothetical protein
MRLVQLVQCREKELGQQRQDSCRRWDALLLDPEILKLRVEMLPVDLQQSGGLGLVALGASEGTRDEQALQLSGRRFKWHR